MIFDVSRCRASVERDDDGKTDRHFSGRDGDDEKNKNLRIVIRQSDGPTRKRENATSERLAALSISSSDIKMMMMLRRSMTPAKPIVKSNPLTKR